jgi:hypothetical protein
MRSILFCTACLLMAAGAATARQPPVTVDLAGAPFVRIGVVDGPPEMTLGLVVGAVRLDDARVAVADRLAHAIRFFDERGAHVRSIGREGEGPAEFRDVTWLGACPDGVLLAPDPMLGRAARIGSADARFIGHVALPSIGFNAYLACPRAGEVVVLLATGGAAGARGQVSRRPAAIARFDLEAGVQDTLAVLPGTDFYYAERVAGFAPVPLGVRALAAAGGGYVYAAQNDGREVHVIDLATGRRNSFAHGLPQPPLTGAAVRAATDAFLERQPLERTRDMLRTVLAEAPGAEAHPRLMDLKADRDGRAWLRLPSAGAVTVWQVHGADGRHAGSVRLPSNVEPVDIGAAHLVAIETDELGVQMLRVYTAERRLIPFD